LALFWRKSEKRDAPGYSLRGFDWEVVLDYNLCTIPDKSWRKPGMDTRKKLFVLHHRRHRKKGGLGCIARLLVGAATVIFFATTMTTMVLAGVVVGVYAYYAKDLPDPEAIETEQEKFETTKIYDRTGQHLLYEVFDPKRGDRTYLPLNEISLQLRQATMAIEDRDFYAPSGPISPADRFRAVALSPSSLLKTC
jgi:hypothetical protein